MLRVPLALGLVATPLMLALPVIGPLLFLLAGLLFVPVALLLWATAEHEERLLERAPTTGRDARAAVPEPPSVAAADRHPAVVRPAAAAA